MAVPSSIPTVLGALAAFATAALVAVLALLIHALVSPATAAMRIVAIVSAALEGTMLFILAAHLVDHVRRRRGSASAAQTKEQHGLWFGLSILLGTAAAGTSVATLVSLGRSSHRYLSGTILGSGVVPYLVGAAVTLGISYVAQLLFLVAHFVVARASQASGRPTHLQTSVETGYANNSSNNTNININSIGEKGSNGSTSTGNSQSLSTRVKSIPYSQTSDPDSGRGEKKAFGGFSRGRKDSAVALSHPRTPPASSGGQPATDVASSIRTSLSNVIRPVTSKTRLISPGRSTTSASRSSSQRSLPWRSASLTGSSASPASTYASRDREQRPSIDDFDSWDTSAVDPQSRQTVLETSASPSVLAGRFLETIPASPTTSRCPSPGMPLDLELPRSRQRRSRSYSPAASSMRSGSRTRMRSQSQSQSPVPPPNEAHIHPLFRSDSPTPPPAVSAGTVVTAAPNGGQVLATDAQSLRTLGRMRSGSLPAVSSPLSRQGSFDEFGARRGLGFGERPDTAGALGGIRYDGACTPLDIHDELGVDDDGDNDADLAERKMTPPIPEWILSAGARTSLVDYQSRRGRQ